MKGMNPELYEVLRELADTFGTTVAHLWSVLVYQARIEAISSIGLLVFMVASLVWTVATVRRRTKGDWDGDQAVVAWIGVWIFAVLAVPGSWFMINNILTAAFNPEYWALKQIIP